MFPVPRGASEVSHASPVARRSRKMQSRRGRSGRACSEGTTVSNRKGDCKSVNTGEQDSQLALQRGDVSKELNDSVKTELLCDKVVTDSDSDDSLSETAYDTESTAASDSEALAPVAETATASTLPAKLTKSVHFDFDATIIHEVTPYAEIYGEHPRTFVFDRDFFMVPAARGGFVSANAVRETDAEIEMLLRENNDEHGNSQEDGGWESWLMEDSSSAHEGELFTKTALGFACVPDDETGWETWLESTLGDIQEQFFDDTIRCSEE